MYVWMYVCLYVCKNVCMRYYVFMHACMYACMHARVFMSMQIGCTASLISLYGWYVANIAPLPKPNTRDLPLSENWGTMFWKDFFEHELLGQLQTETWSLCWRFHCTATFEGRTVRYHMGASENYFFPNSYPPWKWTNVPRKRGHLKRKCHLPTTIFRGAFISFREGEVNGFTRKTKGFLTTCGHEDFTVASSEIHLVCIWQALWATLFLQQKNAATPVREG